MQLPEAAFEALGHLLQAPSLEIHITLEEIYRLNCQINTALAVGFVTNQAASKREQAANFILCRLLLLGFI